MYIPYKFSAASLLNGDSNITLGFILSDDSGHYWISKTDRIHESDRDNTIVHGLYRRVDADFIRFI